MQMITRVAGLALVVAVGVGVWLETANHKPVTQEIQVSPAIFVSPQTKPHLPSQTEALARVLKIRGYEFPVRPGKMAGSITWANPGFSKTIPAEKETEITQPDPHFYLVTLTETWKYTDFHGDPYQKTVTPDQNGNLTHTWVYKVTATDTTLEEDKGNFPPQDTN